MQPQQPSQRSSWEYWKPLDHSKGRQTRCAIAVAAGSSAITTREDGERRGQEGEERKKRRVQRAAEGKMEITNSVDRGMDGCFSFEGPAETARQMADNARTMDGNGAQLDCRSVCFERKGTRDEGWSMNEEKVGGGEKEEHTEHTEARRHRTEESSSSSKQHMGGAFSLSLLLLAPMYQIPTLETHKPAQLPTSTPRLSFISPFSLMPLFSALFPHRLSFSNPLVVVLLPFVATTAMFPDSFNTPALATTSTPPPRPFSPVVPGRRSGRSRWPESTFDQMTAKAGN